MVSKKISSQWNKFTSNMVYIIECDVMHGRLMMPGKLKAMNDKQLSPFVVFLPPQNP